MSFVVRPTTSDERRASAGAISTALLFAPPTDEAWERSRPSWEQMVSFSAWDGDRCLGHAGSFEVATVVPGGARVATDGVSRVGVLPTARRRGVATALMTTLIRDAARRGQVLMSLRASEATIYHRYGFGMAGENIEATIDPRRARPVAGPATGGSFKLLEPDQIVDTIDSIYARVALRRPGVITRPLVWTQRYTRDAVERSKASFVVVHTDAAGVDDGFAQYEVKWNDSATGTEGDGGRGILHDLWAVDDSTELSLWRYLLDIDLITTWTMDERPVDDPIRSAIADRRAHRVVAVNDEQWIRIVDVDAALSARSYRAAQGEVVIAVTDPLIDANIGSWRIDADGATRTDAAPDLTADIAALSAAYLGGRTWRELATVGSVTVDSGDAIGTADLLTGADRPPFCGSFF